MLKIFVVLNLVAIMWVECSNVTENVVHFRNVPVKGRKGRILSFNTDDSGIEINLAFEVPFAKIPVKKAMNSAKGVMANINVGAVALAGIITFITTTLIPPIATLFGQQLVKPMFGKYKTVDKNLTAQGKEAVLPESSQIWQAINTADDSLKANGLDITSCIQRTLCKSVRKSSLNVRSGKAVSNDKILDGLATNDWLRNYIKETPFETAIMSGLSTDSNCNGEFKSCALSQRAIAMAMKKMVKVINEL